MFDLKCKRVGCKFNDSCNCTAKNVKVTSSTKCETYEPSEDHKKTHENLENIEEITRPPIRKNINVGCDAKCIFNENTTCTANGITVQTCEDRTCPNCMTFMPK